MEIRESADIWVLSGHSAENGEERTGRRLLLLCVANLQRNRASASRRFTQRGQAAGAGCMSQLFAGHQSGGFATPSLSVVKRSKEIPLGFYMFTTVGIVRHEKASQVLTRGRSPGSLHGAAWSCLRGVKGTLEIAHGKKQLAQLQNEKQHDIQAHHKQTHKLRIMFIEVVSQFFQIFWDKHSTIANP